MHTLTYGGPGGSGSVISFDHLGGAIIYSMWGGGGGGACGAGAGAACIKGTITLSAQTLQWVIGAFGAGAPAESVGDSGQATGLWNSNLTVNFATIDGGAGGDGSSGGAGGATGDAPGGGTFTVHVGGDGSACGSGHGGSGGGSAGTTGDGAAGDSVTLGTGGLGGSGGGANGGDGELEGDHVATAGAEPGAGGGGALPGGNGLNGGTGKVTFSFTVPAPVTASRTVSFNGLSLTMGFVSGTEYVQSSSGSGNGGFTLSGTSAVVTAWAAGPSGIQLTLSPAVLAGQTVLLSYNGSAGITNGDNALASFSNQAVTNSSTATLGSMPSKWFFGLLGD